MYGSTVFLYCFKTINCFIHKLAHFPTKSKKNDCPGKSSKNQLFSEICGTKTNKLYLPRKFKKKKLIFVNFRCKQFFLNLLSTQIVLPRKTSGANNASQMTRHHFTVHRFLISVEILSLKIAERNQFIFDFSFCHCKRSYGFLSQTHFAEF